MAVRRFGSPTSFWNAAAVLANGVSSVVEVPREAEQVLFLISVSAATTVSVEVAHHGVLTPEGNEPDHSTLPTIFFPLLYIETPVQYVFAGSGAAAFIVPDFEPSWVRLRSSGAATITAGHEGTGE